MTNGTWNPWKLTTIGLALAIVVALVTGLVVANWTGSGPDREARPAPNKTLSAAKPAAAPHAAVASRAPVAPAPSPAPAVPAPAPQAPAAPPQSVVDACNQHAASVANTNDKVQEVVKDGAIGALTGAAIGAAGGAIAGGGKGAGKGAAIGGVVGAGGGALYGLNENRRDDERYRDAYAACMRARGYLG